MLNYISKKEIALIDDDHAFINILSYSFDNHGYRSLIYNNASQALSYFKEIELIEYPLAILTDMRIPSELDTPRIIYDFFKTKNQLDRLIFMTAHWSDFDQNFENETGIKILLKTDILINSLKDISQLTN